MSSKSLTLTAALVISVALTACAQGGSHGENQMMERGAMNCDRMSPDAPAGNTDEYGKPRKGSDDHSKERKRSDCKMMGKAKDSAQTKPAPDGADPHADHHP